MITGQSPASSKASELLPCPMCHGAAKAHESVMGGIRMGFVECTACGVNTKMRDTAAQAAEDWNRRAPLAAEAPDAEAAPVASAEPEGWLYGNQFWERGNPRVTDHVKQFGKPLFDQATPAPEAAQVAPDALPPLPPMPKPVTRHAALGDVYDLMAMHQYAVRYAEQAVAALSSQHQTNQGENNHGLSS